MNTLKTTAEFSMIDGNEAYEVHTKKGILLRPDDSPILFIAGENNKYKFLLRSAFVLNGNKLNLLFMSQNDIVTPGFFMTLKCLDDNGATVFDKELLLCKHGTKVTSGQHFYAELDIPDQVAKVASDLSLKIGIGGTSSLFTLWSPDMSSVNVIMNSHLLLKFDKLAVKKKTAT